MPWDGNTWVPYTELNDWTNATTLIDVGQYANYITNHAFGVLVIIAFFIITFGAMSASKMEMETSLYVSLFMTTILSYLFAALDMVIDEIALAMTFILVASVALLYIKGGSNNV